MKDIKIRTKSNNATVIPSNKTTSNCSNPPTFPKMGHSSHLSLNTTKTNSLYSSIITLPQVAYPWEVRYDSNLGQYYFYNHTTNESQFDHPDEVNKSPLSSPSTGFFHHKDTDSTMATGKRGSFFSTSLKRTLSPKYLFHSSNNNHNSSEGHKMNKTHTFPEMNPTSRNMSRSPSPCNSPSLSQFNQDRTMSIFLQQKPSPRFNGSNFDQSESQIDQYLPGEPHSGLNSVEQFQEESENEEDEDMAQFREHMRLEMQSYENHERLRL